MLHEIQKARCPNARAAKETSKPLLLNCLTKTSLASVQNSDSSHEGQLRRRRKNQRKEPLLPLFHSSFLLVTYTSQAKKCSPRLALLADAGLKGSMLPQAADADTADCLCCLRQESQRIGERSLINPKFLATRQYVIV